MEEKFEFYNEKIYELRKSKGMSQEELADKLGVSRQSIYAWESGKSLPDIENLYKICQVLETQLSELTNLTPEIKEEIKQKKIKINIDTKKVKKIFIISILVIVIIYFIIAIRQFIMLIKLNEKISSIENADNYSYEIAYAKFENNTDVKTVSSDKIYFKDNILRVYHIDDEGEWTEWIDFNTNEEFLTTDNNTNVIKLDVSDEAKLPYEIKSISNNGLVSESKANNLLASLFWGFKYFSFKVQSAGNYYVLKSSGKSNSLFKEKWDTTEFIEKDTGYPVEIKTYDKIKEIITITKYKDIKINETTDEDLKLSELNEYRLIEKYD